MVQIGFGEKEYVKEYKKPEFIEEERRDYILDHIKMSDIFEKLDIDEEDNGKYLCPFHDDTHPSLSVMSNDEVWRCFVCEASGDVIKFVKLYNEIPYNDAAKWIEKAFKLVDTNDKTYVKYKVKAKKRNIEKRYQKKANIFMIKSHRKISNYLKEKFYQKKKTLECIDKIYQKYDILLMNLGFLKSEIHFSQFKEALFKIEKESDFYD